MNDNDLEEMIKVCLGPPSDPNSFDILFKLLDWPDGKYMRNFENHYFIHSKNVNTYSTSYLNFAWWSLKWVQIQHITRHLVRLNIQYV